MDVPTWIPLAFVIVGILMLIAEVAVPGSFIIVPGTVVLVLGILWMIQPAWMREWWSIIVVIIVLIPMTIASIKLYQMLAPPAPPETTVASSLIGRRGVIISEVIPNTITGKVRIENETWSATAPRRIAVGAPVEVVESRGVHVIVAELER
jgi:membrane protein implicated in regulation of membrane protease activity